MIELPFDMDQVLKVDFKNCPVQESLGILGKKWTLLILRNIGLYRKRRFNEMLKITPGLTKRILSMRLKELESENFIEITQKGPGYTIWDLTEKGNDSLAILLVLVQFGSKYYSANVFEDKKSRPLNEIFDENYIYYYLSKLIPDLPKDLFGHSSSDFQPVSQESE